MCHSCFLLSFSLSQDNQCFSVVEGEAKFKISTIFFPVGITVNGKLIGDQKSSNDAKPHNAYIGRLGISNIQLNVKLDITPEMIVFHNGTKQMIFTWLNQVILQHPG